MEEERKKLDGIICTGREKFVRCFNECFFIVKILFYLVRFNLSVSRRADYSYGISILQQYDLSYFDPATKFVYAIFQFY